MAAKGKAKKPGKVGAPPSKSGRNRSAEHERRDRRTDTSEARAKRKREIEHEASRVADTPGVRRKVPVGAAVSLAVVLIVVVVFSLVLWSRSDKPGPALERWAQATRDGDCTTSYGGLSSSARQAPLVGDESNWCRLTGSPEFIGIVTADSAATKGSTACVHATVALSQGPSESRVFVMVREQGSWKVDLGADPSATGIKDCSAGTPPGEQGGQLQNPQPAGSQPAGSQPAGSQPAGSQPAGSQPAVSSAAPANR